MAFVANNPNKKQQDPNDPAANQVVSRGSGAIAPAASPVNQVSVPNTTNPQNTQSGKANFQQYVDANKNKTAALATKLGKNVTNAGNAARTALSTGQNQFNKDVTDNTINLNDDVYNRAVNDPTQVAASSPFGNIQPTDKSSLIDLSTNSAFKNIKAPTVKKAPGLALTDDFLSQFDDNQQSEFEKMRDAKYNGPNSLNETPYYKPVDKAFDKANTATENARSEEGNRSLLEDMQKDQLGYNNQGTLLLNNALLRGDLGARNILQTAASGNDDLDNLLGTAQKNSEKAGDTAENTTNATRKKIWDTFGGMQGEMEKDLKGRSETAYKQAQDQTQQIINTVMSGGTPTDEQLATLGVSRSQWSQLADKIMLYNMQFGDDPNAAKPYALESYIQQELPNINPQNIASQEEYARYLALNRLMGSNGTFLNDPSQAGTSNGDGVDFDIDQALADIQGLYPEPPPPPPGEPLSPISGGKFGRRVKSRAAPNQNQGLQIGQLKQS